MDLILLSGESINNKFWIEEVEKNLRGLFEHTQILYYDHWSNGQPSINLDLEVTKLPGLVGGLGAYIIFAKSICSVLSLRGIHEKTLTPKKCFFVGPAFLVGERNIPGFKSWLQNFAIPSIILTKTSDPVAPAEEIRELLQKYNVQNYEFVEIPGDSHKYEDLGKIQNLMNQLRYGTEA